uniref:Uncharacterized protein n=1 Tax=Rangifer tarandus platyrhynchus TaxID=3082113 RepID=A0ACB0FCM4_RANTA|nr:unnamed protein product [Rangifer tarandus platyrhynchus]
MQRRPQHGPTIPGNEVMGNMGALINMQPLFLLFLLLKPLQFVRINDPSLSDERREELEDYLEDLYATGPTKPPTKEAFKTHVIINSEMPLTDQDYCNQEMRMKRHYCLGSLKECFSGRRAAGGESVRIAGRVAQSAGGRGWGGNARLASGAH